MSEDEMTTISHSDLEDNIVEMCEPILLFNKEEVQSLYKELSRTWLDRHNELLAELVKRMRAYLEDNE